MSVNSTSAYKANLTCGQSSSEEVRRQKAVEAAIELIHSRVSAGGLSLNGEIEKLSRYADEIEKALKIQRY